MTTSQALANSIINNLESRTVNREEKMNTSLNVLAQNNIRKSGKVIDQEFDEAEARGYGQDTRRYMGD